MSEQRAVPEIPNEIEGIQEALDTPQEIEREAIGLRKKYEALKLERDTERSLRESSEQENDRLRGERDGLKAKVAEQDADFEFVVAENYRVKEGREALKQKLADSELAFAHANEVVGKLEADVARLSAPVTRDEVQSTVRRMKWSEWISCSERDLFNLALASRTPPAKP